MSSRQLYDLTPQELVDHAKSVLLDADAKARVVATDAVERPALVARWTRAAQARQAARISLPARRARAIVNLDILHRQQMLGEWPEHINEAVIEEQIHQTTPSVIAEKQEVKKHMGSMLGDWDKAGKLSKRRIRKTKTKTKRRRRRRRHKNTKRR
jgi:hypothetical protein